MSSLRIDATTASSRTAYVQIEGRGLRHLAADHDTVVIQVVGLTGAGGRPITRALRIPADLLRDTGDWA